MSKKLVLLACFFTGVGGYILGWQSPPQNTEVITDTNARLTQPSKSGSRFWDNREFRIIRKSWTDGTSIYYGNYNSGLTWSFTVPDKRGEVTYYLAPLNETD